MITGGLTILLIVLSGFLMFYIGYLCGQDNRDKKWNKDLRAMTDNLNKTEEKLNRLNELEAMERDLKIAQRYKDYKKNKES